MKNLSRFCTIFVIGLLSSAVPLGWYGVIFGLPAVLIASLLTTFAMHKGILR